MMSVANQTLITKPSSTDQVTTRVVLTKKTIFDIPHRETVTSYFIVLCQSRHFVFIKKKNNMLKNNYTKYSKI